MLAVLPRLHQLQVPTKRPTDYFAEMAKSDQQMQKVRDRQLFLLESQGFTVKCVCSPGSFTVVFKEDLCWLCSVFLCESLPQRHASPLATMGREELEEVWSL